MNKYYKIYQTAENQYSVEVINNYTYDFYDLDGSTVNTLAELLDSLNFEDKTEEDWYDLLYIRFTLRAY